MVTGIICEYNPFHLGHKKQIDTIRAAHPEGGIVCLMSGNFVQRGAPAIVDKMTRARAAVLSGADLVLELPVTTALSSAEGFAAGGVSVLSGFCDRLCFGAENADGRALMSVAETLLCPEFSIHLKAQLETGLSFPAARQAALEQMGLNGSLLAKPNNILAVEYCKAILTTGCAMEPMPIFRGGSYHDTAADAENPSATALRTMVEAGEDWERFVPPAAAECFRGAAVHRLCYGEMAILYRLRTMTDEEFEALPFGSEGLWRKLMHAARKEATLEDVIASTKSKRYTRTRLDRMVMCAFLGITEQMLYSSAPYVRVLGFNHRGREILKAARQVGDFPNMGESLDNPYQLLETRCGDLYGLFAHTPESPGAERNYRVFCQR